MNRKIGVQIITFLTIFLFVFSYFSFTVQSITPITQETVIVDIAGNGDYTSIKEAINRADVTDIVYIRKGAYTEHNLVVNKKIEITGEDPSNTIIDCSGNTAFTLTSSFLDINNLQIINTKENAIIIQSGSTGCTISNCIIDTNYPAVAIDIRSGYNTITGCDLVGRGTSRQGVKIHGSNNVVSNCVIQGFSNGVLALIGSNNNQISNCNMLNNEDGVDIRINSNNNTVTGCNIYSNLQGIKIWQNSNNNLVYLNNFLKNDIAAIDSDNNIYDKDAQGNYWDSYQGIDSNGDGIGDTPYTISEQNSDRYPLIDMVLPDFVTQPTNIEITTTKSDSTPSFTWSPSTSKDGIKGYYVKIDNNLEELVSTTGWTSSEPLTDGVHTFYIRAVSVNNKTSVYSISTFSIDSSFIDTDGDGWSDEEEQLYGTDPNISDNYPLDTDDDHSPDTVDTDDDNDGYSDDMEAAYGTDKTNLNDYPTDTDTDGIPNVGSLDGKYTGDEDDDNDGLTDEIETTIGSSTTDGSDATVLYIVGERYYLVDLSQNGIYDISYEPTAKATTGVEKQDDNYLIDSDGDGTWDYIYSTIDGSISTYKEEQQLPIWAIFIMILLPIIIIIFYYFRRRPITYRPPRKTERFIEKPIREKSFREKPLSEKPLKFHRGKKKETVEMIDQTMNVLQHIQDDVEIYMEKLRQIEKQFIEPEELLEEEIKAPEKDTTTSEEDINVSGDEWETGVIVDIHEVESKVDKLLESLDDTDDEDEDK